MYRLNLYLEQIAVLELNDIIYLMHRRNADGITFKVEFHTERELARAITLLIGR